MRRDAFVLIACGQRLRQFRKLAREKKRKASIDLDGRTTSGAGNFLEARGDGMRDGIQAFRAGGIFAERGDGLTGIAADSNARVNFNFTKHGNSVG